MTALPLVFIAGILGSSHCIGMCGPFALTIGSGAGNWKTNFGRQAIYSVGRIFTYAVFGAVAGAAGLYLHQNIPSLVNVAALLAIVSGLFLLYQGLLAARLIRRRSPNASGVPCLAGDFFATFLKSPGLHNVFLAGLFTGMLPCGLVYGFVALAASTGDLLAGSGVMIAFGLGTTPIMMLTGCGASLLSLAARKNIYRVAAWCVILTGLVSIARGAGFVEIPGWFAASGCPMCD
ncbi:MAG: sulfite exporter TauE/SafE family protein [Planctomycetaceae bacterium]|nr:sulfite exporter TauE/SafE family protein [Planctomycetales bacterium]MCB9924747.1 sulfite exporter TauE/SafE family protein [Planctomycetaceae bacterium]